MLQLVNKILGALTISAQIFLVLFDLGWIFGGAYLRQITKRMPQRAGLFLAFLTALIATAGSLFYSQVAHFVPCELCWFQRIFMYPQVILLALALIKKEDFIVDYSLMLAFLGMLISVYHNYSIYFSVDSAVCSATSQVSCAQLVVLSFRYISIPLMSFTAFSLIISSLLWQRSIKKE